MAFLATDAHGQKLDEENFARPRQRWGQGQENCVVNDFPEKDFSLRTLRSRANEMSGREGETLSLTELSEP